MIELLHLTKSYNKGAVKAVDDLSLVVEPGEIFGFLGPNGAGKTTTIKMMVGILASDSGQIKLAGVDLAADPLKAKRKLGYVPDQPDLYERVTGLEYLRFLGDIYQVPEQKRYQRTERLGQAFGLASDLGDPIGSFSHGMRQKLAIMGAMLAKPPILILDEPMVGLDPKSSHLLKEILREHAREGNIVFFSTHVLEVAERFCTRLGIINHGRLIASGTLEELKRGEQETLEEIFLEVTEG
jgi:ABC-2 type transport system ATP-binding protein